MKNLVFHSALLASIGLILAPLAVVHASASPTELHPVATLEGHADWVRSVSFSPDGTLLASGSKDNTIRLWDVSSGQLKAILEGHAGWINSVSFSPDGTLLASGSKDNTIRLWDVASGQLKAELKGHTDWAYTVSFSPDGTLLASGSGDETVRLWDVASGQLKATFEGHTGWVNSVSFSSDGSTVASGSDDGTVRLWDVSSGQLQATFEVHADWVWSVSFLPNGAIVASGSKDDTVKLWDVSSGQLQAAFEGHTDDVYTVAFSPDGTLLASGSFDGTVKLWDTSEWAPSYPQTLTKVSGDGQEGPVGAQLAEPFVVAVLDTRGKPFGGATVTFEVTADGRILSVTTITDANGRASIGLTLGNLPGPNIIEVSVAGLESVTFTAVGYAVPHSLTKVSGDEQEGPAGTQLAEPFVVLVLDEDGAAIAGTTVNFSIAIGGSGRLSVGTAITDASGHASSVLTLGSSPGTNAVEVSVAGLDPVTFTAVGYAAPHRLTKVSGDGQAGPAGAQLAEPFVIAVLDVYGEPFVGATVTFEVTTDGGTLLVTTTTDANGQAAITLTLGNLPGPNTVAASVAGLAPVTFTAVGYAAPHSLTKVSGDDQQGPVGTQLSEPFVVAVLDARGEPFVGATVTFEVTTDGGTLSVTTTTDADGQAAITLTLGNLPGPNTVAASVTGLESVTFTAVGYVTPHSLTKVSGDDQQGPVGTQLAEPFVVLVLDEDDEAIAGATVTFAVTGGDGTLSAATAITDTSGHASSTLTLGSDPGPNTVEATVEGLDPVTFTAVGQGDSLADLFDVFLSGSGKLVALPDSPQLAQNAPNPFNSQTVLSYFLHASGPVRLEVFALTGQRVAVLHQGPQEAGYHRLRWNGRDDAGRPVASGTYLYRLATDEGTLKRKLTLLR